MRTRILGTLTLVLPFVVCSLISSSILAQQCSSSCRVSQQAAQQQAAYVVHTTEPQSDSKAKDIVDTAVAAKSFGTLVAAVKAAGLVEALKGDGPFTVFAPTEEAFKKLPAGTVETLLKPENKAQLAAVLKYHVVSGKIMAGDVLKALEVDTLQGSKAKIGLTIGGANIVKTDIDLSLIHI